MTQKAKILIVDDDIDFVESIKLILEKNGYETMEAYDGEDGLKKIKETRPDLIILDVMMPQKDGYQLSHELKNNPEFEEIPIIQLTAVGSKIPESKYSRLSGMELESDDFIDKPVEPDVLLKRIKDLLK